MFFLIAVLAIVSAAAVLLIKYLARQDRLAIEQRHQPNLPPGQMRPLFEPTAEELRAVSEEEAERTRADVALDRTRIVSARAALFGRQFSAWMAAPTPVNTAELLRFAADLGDPYVFSRIAFEIINKFNEGLIVGLGPDDMTALIDSHYRLLPSEAKASGELFMLRQKIAALYTNKQKGE